MIYCFYKYVHFYIGPQTGILEKISEDIMYAGEKKNEGGL